MKLDAGFANAIQEIETSRGIPRQRIIDALAQGVHAAYEKSNGITTNLNIDVNLKTGIIEAYLGKTVVETVTDPLLEIGTEAAKEIDQDAEIGDTMLLEADISKLGNLAIHTFKQRVKSLIRDAERDKVISLYGNKLFEMINCTVLYTERGDVYVETPDKIEGIIPYKEQIPRERTAPGQRLKCLLTEVRNVRKAPMLLLSRAHPDLLRELMKNEIPEVREGNIEIVSIARDPGQRSKVAVRSKLTELDPVGSCIGTRGIRITAISHDVNDEKIDLVLFKEDPFEFIAEALSPAKVMSVEIFEDERRGVVVVPDDQISLAIGKGWRNVKLASKLTRFYLDVKSVSEMARDSGEEYDYSEDATHDAEGTARPTDESDYIEDEASEGTTEPDAELVKGEEPETDPGEELAEPDDDTAEAAVEAAAQAADSDEAEDAAPEPDGEEE